MHLALSSKFVAVCMVVGTGFDRADARHHAALSFSIAAVMAAGSSPW
jgi:hypothetical protein